MDECRNKTCLLFMVLMSVVIIMCFILERNGMIEISVNPVYTRNDGNPFTTSNITPRLADNPYKWKNHGNAKLAFYALSAVGFRRSRYAGYKSSIQLSGWRLKTTDSPHMKCCIILRNGIIQEFKHPKRGFAPKHLPATADIIECPVRDVIDNVKRVMIEFVSEKCPKTYDKYLLPSMPETPPETNHSFALCLKIVYGRIDNVKLIRWLEYYQAIGVDKVFMYTYHISQETNPTLSHYIEQGFIVTRRYDFPTLNKTRYLDEKKTLVFQDEQVVVYDCLQRLYQYHYIAIIDMDEYLAIRKHDHIKNLMEYLTSKYPNAGGFDLPSYLFIKKPAKSNHTIDVPDYIQTVRRTEGLYGAHSRHKTIVLPSRLKPRFYQTHRYKTFKQYTKVTVEEDVATINHYRHTCYENKLQECSEENLVTDTYFRDFVLKRFNGTVVIG